VELNLSSQLEIYNNRLARKTIPHLHSRRAAMTIVSGETITRATIPTGNGAQMPSASGLGVQLEISNNKLARTTIPHLHRRRAAMTIVSGENITRATILTGNGA
jgi:hypothetical protein